VPDGTGGAGVEAAGPAVPRRQIEALGEGEEQEASGDEQGDGSLKMRRPLGSAESCAKMDMDFAICLDQI